MKWMDLTLVFRCLEGLPGCHLGLALSGCDPCWYLALWTVSPRGEQTGVTVGAQSMNAVKRHQGWALTAPGNFSLQGITWQCQKKILVVIQMGVCC